MKKRAFSAALVFFILFSTTSSSRNDVFPTYIEE